MEHPDVTSALNTGYATYQSAENKACEEEWNEYLDFYQNKIMEWLKDGYQDILREFAESHAICTTYGAMTYEDFLN